MKKISFALLFTVITAAAFILFPEMSKAKKLAANLQDAAPAFVDTSNNDSTASLYDSLHLDAKGLPRAVFNKAFAGYKALAEAGKISNNKLSIADFSQPSTSNRLYVIDVKEKKLLFNTMVAHGKNSGELMASHFSNQAESNQSSLGFYLTAEKYNGKHGLSMRLDGIEASNNNARNRAIVMHAADYVSEGFAKARGYIGRSWGCPAVSPQMNEPIINAIGNGSCLFIYGGQPDALLALK